MESKPIPIENAKLIATTTFPIRQLPAYDKRHKLPTKVDPRSLTWIDELSRSQLDQELQHVLDKFRSQYRFKRRQMDIHGPIDRRAGIETPYFNYEVTVDLDPDDLTVVVWRREISHIRDGQQIIGQEFDACFGDIQWQLEVISDEPFEIVDLIDRIEDLEDDNISVDYDKDLTWCKVNLSETVATLTVFEKGFNISHNKGLSPAELMESLSVFQALFFAQAESPKLSS